MKAREWQRRLEAELRAYGKALFTVTELANISGGAPQVLNVELNRLCKQGIIVRYARGRYGLPDAVAPETLLPRIDAQAYITGAFALHRYNLINQLPAEVTCFTNHRHNRSRVRTTAVGRFAFACVRLPVYAPPAAGVVAGPEQALWDYVFLMRRRGVAPASQVNFRGLRGLDIKIWRELAGRYPHTVQQDAARILRGD